MVRTAPAPAPRRSKEPRSVHLNARVGALFLTVGTKEFGYWIDPLSHDLGPGVRAFRLSKFLANRQEGEPDHYDVTLRTDGRPGTCECKGHLRWGHKTTCKHLASLAALIERGRL